jgi:hypothetical protein
MLFLGYNEFISDFMVFYRFSQILTANLGWSGNNCVPVRVLS